LFLNNKKTNKKLCIYKKNNNSETEKINQNKIIVTKTITKIIINRKIKK
jgi:hypothetical protein